MKALPKNAMCQNKQLKIYVRAKQQTPAYLMLHLLFMLRMVR